MAVKMAGMTGGSSMLRTRRRDANVKPNRKLDRKSSRGVLYENEELRLRTININAEIDKGHSDIKKLKRENEQLKKEILILRNEYDKLEQLLKNRPSSEESDDSGSCCSSRCDSPTLCDCTCNETNTASTNERRASCCQDNERSSNQLSIVPEEDASSRKSNTDDCNCEICSKRPKPEIDKELKPVDVLVHTSPADMQAHIPPPIGFVPPPMGFTLPPPGFHTGGNVEDLLGAVGVLPQMNSFLQKNYILSNTVKTVQTCKKVDPPTIVTPVAPNSFITEKSIEVNYDYPKKLNEEEQTYTEVAQTVVWVEQKVPVRPRSKWGFLFRSRSAPVGHNDEPIYATVKKLPKRVRRMDIEALEKEVSLDNEKEDDKANETAPSSPDTDGSVKTVIEKKLPFKLSTESPDPKRKRFSWRFRRRSKQTEEPVEVVKKDEPKVVNHVHMNGHSHNGVHNRPLDESGKEIKKCRHGSRRHRHSSGSSSSRHRRGSYHDATTSPSERERTRSTSCSSLASRITPPGPARPIPWCACWGAGCL